MVAMQFGQHFRTLIVIMIFNTNRITGSLNDGLFSAICPSAPIEVQNQDTFKTVIDNSGNSSKLELLRTKLQVTIIEDVLKPHNLSDSETKYGENIKETNFHSISTNLTQISEPHSPEFVTATEVQIIKSNTEHALGNQSVSKIFTSSEDVLNILHKRSLKYVQTYTEILEPISAQYTNQPNNNKKKNCTCNFVAFLMKIITLLKNQESQEKSRRTLLEILAHSTPKLSNNKVTKACWNCSTAAATTRKPNRPPGRRNDFPPLTRVSVLHAQSANDKTEF